MAPGKSFFFFFRQKLPRFWVQNYFIFSLETLCRVNWVIKKRSRQPPHHHHRRRRRLCLLLRLSVCLFVCSSLQPFANFKNKTFKSFTLLLRKVSVTILIVDTIERLSLSLPWLSFLSFSLSLPWLSFLSSFFASIYSSSLLSALYLYLHPPAPASNDVCWSPLCLISIASSLLWSVRTDLFFFPPVRPKNKETQNRHDTLSVFISVFMTLTIPVRDRDL